MHYPAIWISGHPYPKGSWTPVKAKGGKIKFRPANPKWSKWYNKAHDELKERWTGPLLKGPVEVKFLFLLPRLKTVLRTYPTGKFEGDIDKLVRAVLDAMTGSVYEDDCQVVTLTGSKRYTDGEPGVWIYISTDI